MTKKSAVVEICKAIYEAVKSSENGLVEGELYAFLMPYGCTMDHYQQIIGILVEAKLVKVEGHVVKVRR